MPRESQACLTTLIPAYSCVHGAIDYMGAEVVTEDELGGRGGEEESEESEDSN